MLRIKDNVDLKELEKFGFERKTKTEKTWKSQYGEDPKIDDFYIEIIYTFDDNENTIDILQERTNSDWKHANGIREIYVYESDHEMGVSINMLDKIYELIQAGFVEKVIENNNGK